MRAMIGALALALMPVAAEAQAYDAFGGHTSNPAGYGRSPSSFGAGYSLSTGRSAGPGYGYVFPSHGHTPPAFGRGRPAEGVYTCQAIGCTAGRRSSYRGYPGYGGAYKGRADGSATPRYSGYSSGQMYREPVDDCRWIGGYGWAC